MKTDFFLRGWGCDLVGFGRIFWPFCMGTHAHGCAWAHAHGHGHTLAYVRTRSHTCVHTHTHTRGWMHELIVLCTITTYCTLYYNYTCTRNIIILRVIVLLSKYLL